MEQSLEPEEEKFLLCKNYITALEKWIKDLFKNRMAKQKLVLYEVLSEKIPHGHTNLQQIYILIALKEKAGCPEVHIKISVCQNLDLILSPANIEYEIMLLSNRYKLIDFNYKVQSIISNASTITEQGTVTAVENTEPNTGESQSPVQPEESLTLVILCKLVSTMKELCTALQNKHWDRIKSVRDKPNPEYPLVIDTLLNFVRTFEDYLLFAIEAHHNFKSINTILAKVTSNIKEKGDRRTPYTALLILIETYKAYMFPPSLKLALSYLFVIATEKMHEQCLKHFSNSATQGQPFIDPFVLEKQRVFMHFVDMEVNEKSVFLVQHTQFLADTFFNKFEDQLAESTKQFVTNVIENTTLSFKVQLMVLQADLNTLEKYLIPHTMKKVRKYVYMGCKLLFTKKLVDIVPETFQDSDQKHIEEKCKEQHAILKNLLKEQEKFAEDQIEPLIIYHLANHKPLVDFIVNVLTWLKNADKSSDQNDDVIKMGHSFLGIDTS